MDSLKKPEVMLTIVVGVALGGLALYFFRQQAAQQIEMMQLSARVASVVEKADPDGTQNRLNSLEGGIRNVSGRLQAIQQGIEREAAARAQAAAFAAHGGQYRGDLLGPAGNDTAYGLGFVPGAARPYRDPFGSSLGSGTARAPGVAYGEASTFEGGAAGGASFGQQGPAQAGGGQASAPAPRPQGPLQGPPQGQGYAQGQGQGYAQGQGQGHAQGQGQGQGYGQGQGQGYAQGQGQGQGQGYAQGQGQGYGQGHYQSGRPAPYGEDELIAEVRQQQPLV